MNTILKDEVKRVFCNCEGDNDVEDLIECLRGAPKESLHQLLIKMIMFKSLPLVQLVVESGAEIEEPIGEGITPLLYACQEGQLEIVDYLAKMGASPFKCCERGRNALMFAVMGRSLPAVKWAVNHGISLSATMKSLDSSAHPNGLNALHAAVGVPSQFLQEGDEEKICAILDYLIEQGATPPKPSESAPCPLQLAMANELYKAAKILGKICPKPSLYDSPMILALSEILINYLEAGADVEEKNEDGDTPLVEAIRRGSFQDNSTSAFLLIEHGANIHVVSSSGWTLLHQAAMFGRYEGIFPLIEFLLEQGLDINARDHSGNTPLDIAIGFNVPSQFIEFFQSHGGIAITENPSLTS